MSQGGLRATSTAYAIVAAAALAAFVAGGILVSATLPYHEWDAFSFGDWSRHVAGGGRLDPYSAGIVQASRPVFFYLQGGLWAITGVSFTAGRFLALGFAVALVLATASTARLAARAAHASALYAALSAFAVFSVPAFSDQAVAGGTDVPAAAVVAVCAWLARRQSPSVAGRVALAAAAAGAAFTKPTTLAALVGLAGWALVDGGLDRQARLRRAVLPIAVGVAVGLVYLTWMATRFHTSLVSFLRTAATEGIWAQRAAAARPDAVLRIDVLGESLRLPLAFALAYGAARTIGVSHRRAYRASLLVALVWSVAGPIAAGAPSSFESVEQAFAFIGFATVLCAGLSSREGDAPCRPLVAGAFGFSLLPLVAWAWASPEVDRLAATAWPGLAVLLAASLVPAVRALARLGAPFAIAPVTVLAASAWIGISGLDGLHGHQWTEYRSLRWSGLGDRARTMNIVLPQLQQAIAAVKPLVGDDGLVSAWDPRFTWFMPGRIDQEQALRCSDLRNDSVFVELTDDEAVESARLEHGLATPAEWGRCAQPKLHLVTESISGYAIFKVS